MNAKEVLKELKETYGYTSQELQTIHMYLNHYALSAIMDNEVQKEVMKESMNPPWLM